MFQRARAFLGQRFAAAGAIDYWLYLLLAMSVVATSVLTSSNLDDAEAVFIVFIANVGVVSLLYLSMIALDLLLKIRKCNLQLTLGVLVGAGVAIGSLKGLLTWHALEYLGFDNDALSGLGFRVSFSAVTGFLVLPVVALFGSLRYRYAEQREALISEKIASEGGESYPETLVRFVESAKLKLAKSKKGNGPHALAAELREIVNSDLRPLSHEIWVRESRKFPSFRLSQIAKVAIGNHVYSSSWVIPIWALTTFSATLRVFSLEEGFVIQAMRALILFLGLYVASKIRVRSFAGALTVYVVSIFLVCVIQIYLGTFVSETRSFGDDVGFMIANLAWLYQLTLFVGMGKAFLEMRQRVETEFATFLNAQDIAEIKSSRELMLRDRQLAQFLHGHMQTRLNGVASKLESDQSPGEINSDLDLVERVLNEALAEFGKEQTKTLVDAIAAIERDWGGVVQLSFALKEVALDESQVEIVREVINEAVANAVRHGFASRVSIVMTEGPTLEITDDGTGPRDGKPGLGTTYFDSVSRNWQLESTGSGARLEIDLTSSAS